MTKTLVLEAFSLIMFFGFSCNKEQPAGKWKDNIKLSQKKIEFDSSANTATVTTKFSGWWLNNIGFNGKMIDISYVKRTAKNFVIQKPEFKVERKDGKKIIISMSRNKSGSDRILTIGLQDGDYFDGIKVIQAK